MAEDEASAAARAGLEGPFGTPAAVRVTLPRPAPAPLCRPRSALVARIAAAVREELAIAMRGVYLFLLFLPAVATAPVCLLADAHRQRWLELLRWTLEQAGPAFIKVGSGWGWQGW